MLTLVIARAYGGKPLKRLVVKSGEKCVYLVNPRNLRSVESGDTHPVGFPIEDVYQYESKAYDALTAEWAKQSMTSPESWRGLKQYLKIAP